MLAPPFKNRHGIDNLGRGLRIAPPFGNVSHHSVDWLLSCEDYDAILPGFGMPQISVIIDALRGDKTRFASAVKAV